MNASPLHPKVRVTCKLSDPLYVAGSFIAGKMEVECRTDKGLGLGVIMVELFAVEGQHYCQPARLSSLPLIFAFTIPSFWLYSVRPGTSCQS